MQKIDYCFHSHTYRCGHARGEDKEYVELAIKNGIKYLGFSDHAFLPNIDQPGVRGKCNQIDEYVSSIRKLQDIYKDKIKIYVGFEAEYCDRFYSYYKDLLDTKKIDFLILGQHCNFNYSNNPRFIGGTKDETEFHNEEINLYVSNLIKAMETGLFKYIAHPDLFLHTFRSFDKRCEEITRKLCEVAEHYQIPFEINCHGSRYWKKGEYLVYPVEEFWKIVSEYDVPVVIGYDAHSPIEFDEDITSDIELAKKLNLKLINLK